MFGELKTARTARAEALKVIRKGSDVPGKLFGEVSDEEIAVGVWRNRIYKKGDIDALEKGIRSLAGDGNTNLFLKTFGRAVDVGVYAKATLDFAAPFLQGLPMLIKDRRAWTKGTLKHYEAFFDPTVQAQYVRANIGTLQEMALYGVPMGDSEFFRAVQKGRGVPLGKMLELLPDEKNSLPEFFGQVLNDTATKVGRKGKQLRLRPRSLEFQRQTIGRFQSSYDSFLTVVRAEHWKAMRSSWTREGREGNTLAELGAYMRNMTGGLDVRGIGVGKSWREFERMWVAFSPKLMRSTMAIVADGLKYPVYKAGRAVGLDVNTTVRHKESAKALASVAGAMHGYFILGSVARAYAMAFNDENREYKLGKNISPPTKIDMDRLTDDLAQGLNPLNFGKYLSIDMNGQWIGPGAQFRGMTQMLYGLVSGLAPGGKPLEDIASLHSDENPFVGYMANRGALGTDWLKTTIEGVTGLDTQPFENIEGPWDMIPHLATGFLPMVIEGIMEGDKMQGVLSGEIGGRTSPLSPSDQYEAKMKDTYYQKTEEELAPYYSEEDAPGAKWGIAGEAIEAATGGKVDMQRTHDWPERENGRKTWKRDVPKDLQADLREQDPELQELYELDREHQIKQGTDYGKYIAKQEDFAAKRDETIEEAARVHGPGGTLRKIIDDENREYRTNVEDLKKDFGDMMMEFDEADPSRSAFNRAIDEYWFALTDPNRPPIDDPIYGYDHWEKERRIEELKQNPNVAPYVERVQDHINRTQSGARGELNTARNFIAPYWEVEYELMKDVGNGIEPEHADFFPKYELHKSQNATNRQAMLEGEMPTLDWTYDDAEILNEIVANTSDRRKEMREGEVRDDDGKITWSKLDAIMADGTLVKWGYGQTSNDWFEMIVDEIKDAGNGYFDHRLIDEGIRTWLRENPHLQQYLEGERHSDYR